MSLTDQPGDRAGAPIAHVIAASFVAGVVATFVLMAGIEIRSTFSRWRHDGTLHIPSYAIFLPGYRTQFLGIACVILIAPIHLLAMRFLGSRWPRLARWAYLAPTAVIAYLVCAVAVSFERPSDLARSSTTEILAIALAIAASVAITFQTAVNRKRHPPGGWVLAALALTWFAANIAGGFGAPLPTRVSANPLATRNHVLDAWRNWGLDAMFRGGIAAYAVWQFRMPRAAAGLLLAGIAAPLPFIGWYFSVPLGDGFAHFSVGNRTVLIDWRREPHQSNGILVFNLVERDAYQIAHRVAADRTLTVSPATGSVIDMLELGELPAASREQWGLACYDIKHRYNFVAICGQSGTPKDWTTVVSVAKGYAHQIFDRDGVRYRLDINVEDAPKWRDTELAAAGALDAADMSRK